MLPPCSHPVELALAIYPVNCLSDAEKERMESFKQQRHRDQYYLSHVILRIVLGEHMKCTPKTIHIVSNAFGKPYIRDSPEFRFNLSHTDGAIALGIANNSVGVDIENTSSRRLPKELYSRIFTEEEKSSLSSEKTTWRLDTGLGKRLLPRRTGVV
jgi:4'-phosphopantetheinyl transferase